MHARTYTHMFYGKVAPRQFRPVHVYTLVSLPYTSNLKGIGPALHTCLHACVLCTYIRTCMCIVIRMCVYVHM